MGALINFLLDNFMILVFICVILILALIGYIVDTTKTNRLKNELKNDDDKDSLAVPLANIDSSITLGDTVNKMAMNGVSNQTDSSIPKPVMKTVETQDNNNNNLN